jgi:hypothetical protein
MKRLLFACTIWLTSPVSLFSAGGWLIMLYFHAANWTAKPQLLTRKVLLKSIPAAFNVYEYEFTSSKRPGR